MSKGVRRITGLTGTPLNPRRLTPQTCGNCEVMLVVQVMPLQLHSMTERRSSSGATYPTPPPPPPPPLPIDQAAPPTPPPPSQA